MADKKIITRDSLNQLINKIIFGGTRVLAPIQRGEKIVYDQLQDSSQMVTDYIQTEMSPKKAVFPKYEEVLHYTIKEDGVEIHDEKDIAKETVVIGSRPCDAKSLAVLDAVFLKDGEDIFYKNRREKLTMISISCPTGDKDCFCTSLGGSPGDTSGSDILLTAVEGDKFLAEILSPRGQKIVDLAAELFSDGSSIDKEKYLADIPVRFDSEVLLKKTEDSFENPIYYKQSLRCLGCGVCTYVCPTCSCFDLQDETHGNRGIRIRLWDSCGFGHFTLHTSWHNPRNVQSKRWRQRLMHKFYYQPDTMGLFGCVGCGRCSRSCPADMSILDHLKTITEI